MAGRIRRLSSPLLVGLAGIAVVALATMAFASAASAKSLYFVGEADDDGATTIHFKAKGHYEKGKKGKKFVAEEVSLIRVYDQQFVCYTANGSPTTLSGRNTYIGYSFIEPIEVDKGRFGSFYRTDFEYDKFRGRIKNKKATGAYQTQASEGGIELGYCGDKNPVDWTAKAQRNAPEPPPDPELAQRAAINGSLTLEIEDGGFGDGLASGRIDSKKICAAFRQIRVKLLNPPRGYRQPEATYGEPNRKHYTAVLGIPSEPGTYRFRARAKKTRVARGLRRAKCAEMTSPVVEVTVPATPAEQGSG